MSLRGIAIAAVLALGLARSAAAAPEISPPIDPQTMTRLPPGSPDPLRVFVMTMGPGDHPFFRFGHNAIWIRDQVAGTDKVYNFGTFRFDSPRLIFDFLGGRLNYWLSVSSLQSVIAGYTRENRDIAVQELNLPPKNKEELRTALEVNARPENRLYKYDYFRDNCSTRVRDAVDRVAFGIPKYYAGAPGRMTLRQHALRMTARPLWLYVALDVVLGPKVDEPIDQWTEMFLPSELARGLDAVQLTFGVSGGALITDADGRPVPSEPHPVPPLVSGQAQLFRADRPPILEWPPARGRAFALCGVLFGLAVFALGRAGRWRRPARVAVGILTTLWGLAVGFIGCFLIYVWAFTDHVVAHRNQNILLCVPWAIALFVLGIGVAMGRPGATRKAFALSVAALAAVLVACVLKVVIAVPHQENGRLIAFFLPAWVGVTAALLQLRYAAAHGTTGLGRSRL